MFRFIESQTIIDDKKSTETHIYFVTPSNATPFLSEKTINDLKTIHGKGKHGWPVQFNNLLTNVSERLYKGDSDNFEVLCDFILSIDMNPKLRKYMLNGLDFSLLSMESVKKRWVEIEKNHVSNVEPKLSKETSDLTRKGIEEMVARCNQAEKSRNLVKQNLEKVTAVHKRAQTFLIFLKERYTNYTDKVFTRDLIELNKTELDLKDLELGKEMSALDMFNADKERYTKELKERYPFFASAVDKILEEAKNDPFQAFSKLDNSQIAVRTWAKHYNTTEKIISEILVECKFDPDTACTAIEKKYGKNVMTTSKTPEKKEVKVTK